MQPSAPVLVVDLDGTLCQTDTLHEGILAAISAKPWRLLMLIKALFSGKVGFKHAVSDFGVMEGRHLPYNAEVIALVEQARAAGRRTALVSASDQRQVSAVADHLGLFDEAFGTGDDSADRNLSGANKAKFLVDRYGAKGFDYVGDAPVDVPVWAEAATAVTVNAGPTLRAAAQAANANVRHLAAPKPWSARVRPYLRALRPHQWSKNFLVFVPMLSAFKLTALPPTIAAFVAFSLTASSVYLINDLLDLTADREHKRKRKRPFAAGEIPVMHGIFMAPVLVLMAVAISLAFAAPPFLFVLAAYYVVTFAYSLSLKRKLILDVIALAGLYTARIIGGAAATGIQLSPWLLGFSMFLFLSLAAVKRQAELTDQKAEGRKYVAGRAYETDDLPVLRDIATSAGYASVLVFALYINTADVSILYGTPELLWLVCPVVLYWITRMVMMTHRGQMTDDPIVFAAKDPTSSLCIALGVSIIALARVWP